MSDNKIGHSCPTCVIAETLMACDKTIEECLGGLFADPENDGSAAHRYDLISLPELGGLLDDDERYAMLVEDILIAIRLHHTERLAVIAPAPVHRALAAKLAADPKLRDLTISPIAPITDAGGPGTLVIGCMDWRLHGTQGGFEKLLAGQLGHSDFAVMALPGAGKDIVPESPRGPRILDLVKVMADAGRLKNVVLVAHTDCGKYGGKAAFSCAEDELNRLADDLRKAAAYLNREAGLMVSLAVAHIGDGRTDKIVADS